MPYTLTDASPLIALSRVDRLDLLPAVFAEAVAPPAVVAEFGVKPSWLREVKVEDRERVGALRALRLDAGESEVIALALEHPGSTLLLANDGPVATPSPRG